VLALILMAALVCCGGFASAEGTAEGIPQSAEPTEAEPVDEGVQASTAAEDNGGGSVLITVTAVGDCTFSGEVGSKSNKRFLQCLEKYGCDYFFQNVRDLFEADDLTIVNLEGPITDSDKPRKHGYVFKADPACVEILSGSSVELCNLANNHSMDYGARGLKDTAETLEASGIGYCGFTEAWSGTIKGVRVTALGFTKWDNTAEEIYEAVSRAREDCDLLIVNMHWGWERQYRQVEAQETWGRLAVDAGADLVIGTHPHVYQGIEKYKGRYIVSSLGNFCFAGNANPEDKRCLIFQQTFSFNPGMGIVQANFMDAGINIIPATISSVPDNNDFVPTIMPPQEGAALLKAVAESSTHFSLSNSLWMKDNYLVTNGLVKEPEEEQPLPSGQ
ncbi:MAG: CapA family protein, partial [Clostridia bacterium]|nr:CapA family protein [Clostridia bacterium]